MAETKQPEITRSKKSYGIACCKYIDHILHVLMVKKKYTYSFFEFVFCKYPKFDRLKLEKLFDGMTFQEKSDILEMDFNKLWCKILLNIPEDPYQPTRNKVKLKRTSIKKRFESTYFESISLNLNQKEKEYKTYLAKKQRFLELIEDGGRRLREIINHSRSADSIWEIPKGRPNDEEKPLDTANREFTEETNGTINNYKIIYEIEPIKVNYVNACCLYENEYFVALADDKWIPQFQYNCYECNSEVEELRWVSAAELKFLNRGQHNYKRMNTLLNTISHAIKKYKPLTNKIVCVTSVY